MNKRHAVYEYHSTNSQLDVYHGSTYTPTTDVLCAMTSSKNLRAPHDWPDRRCAIDVLDGQRFVDHCESAQRRALP